MTAFREKPWNGDACFSPETITVLVVIRQIENLWIMTLRLYAAAMIHGVRFDVAIVHLSVVG